MVKHAKLLDGWATALIAIGGLTILAGLSTGIASNWWAGLLIAAGCLPAFILSAICHGLALLLRAQAEARRELHAARDRQIEDEMNDQLAAELQSLHRRRQG